METTPPHQAGKAWVVGITVLALVAIGGWYIASSGSNGTTDTGTNTPATTTQDNQNGEKAATRTVQVSVINVGGGSGDAAIGCGDSLTTQEYEVATSEALRASLTKLFELGPLTDTPQDGDTYNALHQSDLTVDSVSIENRTATVALSGELLSGGTCDDPRIEHQLRETVLQFDTVDEAAITINGTPLKEYFNAQGNQ